MSNKLINKIYEISFHILVDAEVSKELKGIEKIISTLGGVVLNIDEPEKINLAYEIKHNIRDDKGVFRRYTESFFGSIKFKFDVSNVKELEKFMTENKNILRFLLVETIEEETRMSTEDTDEKNDELEELTV